MGFCFDLRRRIVILFVDRGNLRIDLKEKFICLFILFMGVVEIVVLKFW